MGGSESNAMQDYHSSHCSQIARLNIEEGQFYMKLYEELDQMKQREIYSHKSQLIDLQNKLSKLLKLDKNIQEKYFQLQNKLEETFIQKEKLILPFEKKVKKLKDYKELIQDNRGSINQWEKQILKGKAPKLSQHVGILFDVSCSMKDSLQAYENEWRSKIGDPDQIDSSQDARRGNSSSSGATNFLWDLIDELLSKFDEETQRVFVLAFGTEDRPVVDLGKLLGNLATIKKHKDQQDLGQVLKAKADENQENGFFYAMSHNPSIQNHL